MKNNKISLYNGIIFTIVGIIVFLNPESIVKFVSYFIGGLLIALGSYKAINYYVQDKKNGIVNNNEMGFGITSIVLGVLFIFLAGAIEMVIRFIIGGWFILSGVKRISDSFFTTDRTSKFYSLIVVGFIFIAVGLYTIFVSNITFSILGLFMLVYGIIEFVSYFMYRNMFSLKENTIQEAKVIETKDEE